MMKQILIVISLIFLLPGCGIVVPLTQNKGKLTQLEIGQSKETVEQNIGSPDEIRGSMKNTEGKTVTVWQYNLCGSAFDSIGNFFLGIFIFTASWWIVPHTEYNSYWIYFVDGQLAQWGRAGDWREDVIMKVKLETSQPKQ